MSASDLRGVLERRTVVTAIVLLLAGLIVTATLRATIDWPAAESEKWLFLIVAGVSVSPLVFAFIALMAERGGVFEYAGMKVDFSRMHHLGMASITVPVNIGVRGTPVADSSSTEILDTLRKASTCDVVVVDLEVGQAWWETRLLVLVAGAERLNKPSKIVFVGTESNKRELFQGWAHARELREALLHAHPQYSRSFLSAKAAGRQWEMVEPVNPPDPAIPAATPAQPSFVQGALATAHTWMAFHGGNGLPNDLLTEQLLQSDLGNRVESLSTPKTVSLVRLNDLFGAILNREWIDLSWPKERQLNEFLSNDAPYLAVTQGGKYLTIVSRLAVLNELLRPLVAPKRGQVRSGLVDEQEP
jgi:hypothetical protein